MVYYFARRRKAKVEQVKYKMLDTTTTTSASARLPRSRSGSGRRPRLPPRPPGRRIRPWRLAAFAVQAAALLGLPFLTVNGRSALRFDVARLELHVFGAVVWMDELFVVLAALFAIGFGFLLVTVLLGRVWCGWTCPQTALAELTGFVRPGPAAGRLAAGRGPRGGGARSRCWWRPTSPGTWCRRGSSCSG